MYRLKSILVTFVQLVELDYSFSFGSFISISMKSLSLTYLFAFIGGLVGFHHFYLARIQHAVLWLTTFGGFTIGWVYEVVFKLNQYVRENNRDELTIQIYQKKIKERKSPAFELKRFFSEYLTSIFYGCLTYYAFPDSCHQNIIFSFLIAFFTCLSIAIGVQLAGTLGARQCSFLWPFLGAIIGLPFVLGYHGNSPSFTIVALFSCCLLEWKIDWNLEYFSHEKKQHSFLKCCFIYGSSGLIFSLILTSAIYQNLQVDINGERVKIKDVLGEFFRSHEFTLIYQQLKNIIEELYGFYLENGFKGFWTEIWTALDSQSDRQAYDTLNLPLDASQQQIDSQCRTLARKWHPDRYRDPIGKKQAETNFINIQQACDYLSNERKRRQILNSQRRDNPK